MNAPDVVIIGGGVVGLSIAYALRGEGIGVAVLDRGPLERGASWAGAGIIAPASERPPEEPLAALRDLSARLYADWSACLRAETGMDNGYRACGGLDVAFTAGEMNAIATRAELWGELAVPFTLIGRDELRRLEPGLDPAVQGGALLPGRAQVRTPWHMRALEAGCVAAGVAMRSDEAVEGFEIEGGRIAAVRTRQGRLPCGQVVLAAGAWSGAVAGLLGIELPTPPVKGQIVLLRCERPPIERIVELGANYLVPREDGRVLAGATEEDAGYDTRSTAVAVAVLIELAIALCPALAEAEVERAWAGVRPGNRDGRPTIGRAEEPSNLVIATGHRRAGLQLAPGTAMVVADLLAGRPPRIALERFRPQRDMHPPGNEAFRS